jgi:sirohydrochlorin ferrochelatase
MVTARLGLLLTALIAVPATSFGAPGILLLAHGGGAEWNGHVTALAAEVNRTTPTEVAFGMATRSTLQAGIDRLVARGVTEVVAVPLFVSSWSSIITSTEYLLGLRTEAPPALAIYAKMDHSKPAAGAAASGGATAVHDGHAATVDGTKPITSPVPVRMTAALNDHPIVADILVSRARSIGRTPSEEAIVIVAHGPNEDNDNRRWLADLASLAEQMRGGATFASIDYLTLRDDAPKPVRDEATAQLRALVSRRLAEGRRVLIVPLLVSFGGIDRGIRERLEGLSYAMPGAGLVPDDRLAAWVLTMARPAADPAGSVR